MPMPQMSAGSATVKTTCFPSGVTSGAVPLKCHCPPGPATPPVPTTSEITPVLRFTLRTDRDPSPQSSA